MWLKATSAIFTLSASNSKDSIPAYLSLPLGAVLAARN